MLKNRIENEVNQMGMDIPFQNDIKKGYAKAKAAHIHSCKCKEARARRNKQFNKVRVLYWNLMALLTGIVLVSVGRIMYDVIRIIKM